MWGDPDIHIIDSVHIHFGCGMRRNGSYQGFVIVDTLNPRVGGTLKWQVLQGWQFIFLEVEKQEGFQTPARPTLPHSPAPLQLQVVRERREIQALSTCTLTAVKSYSTTSTINAGLTADEKKMVDCKELKED